MVDSPALVASEVIYLMPGTPLIARSIIIKEDFTNTSALAPGKDSDTVTRGGAMSGNWAIGKVRIASAPINRNTSDNTIAMTGLLINILNIISL